MRATGIVRRIDDLGRVVIPKEIRRTLRIREGDPLEIFTDRTGGIILKKYSPISELGEFSKGYAESLQQTTGGIVLITDKDTIISISGGQKKEYLDKRISMELEESISERTTLNITKKSDLMPLFDYEDIDAKYTAQIIAPILAEGDAIGAVVIASTEENKTFGEVEIKLAETAASFLGKQMED